MRMTRSSAGTAPKAACQLTFMRRALIDSGRWTSAAGTGFAVSLWLFQASITNAAEIRMFSAYVTRPIMGELGPQFEKASGHKLKSRFANTKGIVKRIRGGEMPDVVITNQDGINVLLKDGKVVIGNVAVIARSGIGVAVRKGSPKPDISSPAALRRALLAARSITYNNPAYGGTSGTHVAKVLEQLGIAGEMRPKTLFSTSDAGLLVASGKAELGITQMSSLMRFKGVEIAGLLPGDLQSNVVYSAAILNGVKNAEAAKSLVDFLRGPEAAKVYKAKGMVPG